MDPTPRPENTPLEAVLDAYIEEETNQNGPIPHDELIHLEGFIEHIAGSFNPEISSLTQLSSSDVTSNLQMEYIFYIYSVHCVHETLSPLTKPQVARVHDFLLALEYGLNDE